MSEIKKTLLIFEAGLQGAREYWLQDFKSAGYKLVLAQPWPLSWEASYVEDYLMCSLNPWNETAKMNVTDFAKFHNVVGVVCLNEGTVPYASEVTSLLNLPIVTKSDIQILRNKVTMRKKLAESEICQPNFVVVSGCTELKPESITYPAVVKPAQMMSSLGVKLVNNYEETIIAIQIAKEVDFDDENLRQHYGFSSDVLIEDYVNGDEYSFESFVQKGCIVDFFITKKFKCAEPYFDEIGHLAHPKITEELYSAIKNFLTKLHDNLEIQNAVTHTEAKVVGLKIVLIEIACRPGGDMIPKIHSLSANFNFAQAAAEIFTGVPVSKKIVEKSLRRPVAVFFPHDTKKTKITKNMVMNEMLGASIIEFIFGQSEPTFYVGLRTARRGYIIYSFEDVCKTEETLIKLSRLPQDHP